MDVCLFLQAEDGIRDLTVTGVQTCALPICSCGDGRLQVTVRDDGPGHGSDAGTSHQFGLRSLRERLQAAYGSSAELSVHGGVGGFEASFSIPACGKSS